MREVFCLDERGDTVDVLTQWDTGQKFITQIDNLYLSSGTQVHFMNKNSKESIVSDVTISDGKLMANIPDKLLQVAEPIYVYIYLDNNASAKSIAICKIPVRRKAKPQDYKVSDIITQEQFDKITDKLYETIEYYDSITANIDNLETKLNSLNLPDVATAFEVVEFLGFRKVV